MLQTFVYLLPLAESW